MSRHRFKMTRNPSQSPFKKGRRKCEYRNHDIEFQYSRRDTLEVIFLCPERAPACFNARGWILTTDFTAPSWTLHPKVLNELHSQNRRRLYYRRPPRCKDMIRQTENRRQGDFDAYPPLSFSLPQGARGTDLLLGILSRQSYQLSAVSFQQIIKNW